ncbi:MAG: SDR family NAD(P)-dependent oxidoreductase [Candidatus Gastranaerophilales bacterium]|nr:SDR family NAD(P)-dependent oxidoreductase [Candidatus Gastranaerophilales bacterium]
MQTTRLNEPTALITGASRGIGAAIADAFAQAGYRLILTCDRSFDDLTKLAADLVAQYGISCKAYQADMGDYSQVQEVFSQVSRLDVLINNAGISYMGLLSEMDVADWRRVMAVNLDSCFYTCKCAIPLMLREHAGHILNISSVWGNVGASMEVAYSASKGGMNSFTKALAKELAPSNIQVNAIACGVIDTAMNACLSPEDIAALTAEIPADRLGSREEVAQLALQIVSSPSYMTGQIITIDGGWY